MLDPIPVRSVGAMSVRMHALLTAEFDQLRYEPIEQRVRAVLGTETVLDSTRARLIWEPRRVVPAYAVPEEDVHAELIASVAAPPVEDPGSLGFVMPTVSSLPVLDPSIPFTAHTAKGEPVALQGRAGFRLMEPDLDGYVVFDFDGFDGWYEEEDLVVSHPRSPFHRIDALPSTRTVRVEVDGHLIAESQRAHFLFETMLPVRFYLPREDVAVPLRPSATRSRCAYKGEASYWSAEVDGRVIEDLAWSYEDPRPEASAVQGLVAFFNERVDITLEGVRRERPLTPWS